VHLL
ncbi:hypothetical protein D043_4174B, partial [Vibrio parahaemolyticus EKP-021]